MVVPAVLAASLYGVSGDAQKNAARKGKYANGIYEEIFALLILADRPLKNFAKWEDVGLNDISKIEISLDGITEDLCRLPSLVALPSFINHHGTPTLPDNFLKTKKEVEKAIRKLPIKKIMEEKEGRREAFQTAFQKIIRSFKPDKNLQTSRIMVLWLSVLAHDLDRGKISLSKHAIIDAFRCALDMEDDVFDDLQESAATLHKELARAMTLILE